MSVTVTYVRYITPAPVAHKNQERLWGVNDVNQQLHKFSVIAIRVTKVPKTFDPLKMSRYLLESFVPSSENPDNIFVANTRLQKVLVFIHFIE